MILSVTIAATTVMETHAQKTLRGRLRPKTVITSNENRKGEELRFDTITVSSQTDIRLSGYDKPLNSRKESLFVSNKLPCEIVGLNIRLTYSDMSGRTLHETIREIRADIPSGTTRRIEFPSWDKQNSFYYYGGRQPRVANVTPYKVACNVISYIVMPDAGTADTDTINQN